MSEDRVIAVDLGGTKILAGLIDRDGVVQQTIERPTVTTSQAALIDELVEAVRSLPQEGVRAVGFGIPSRIDHENGIAIGAVNIPLRDVPFRQVMRDRLELPIGMENDATCAAYGEYHFGAGKGVRNLVMLTLGTGVGGGVIANGELFHGWTELGHIVIVEDGEPCQGSCTGRGHVEPYCSGRAADKIAQRVLGGDANAHDLVAAHHPALGEIGRHLGMAIGSLVNVFGPERVVIGGGFGIAAGEQLLPAARPAILRESLAPGGEDLELVLASLGAQAGLIGAGLIAFEAIGTD
jgi:glucokinase